MTRMYLMPEAQHADCLHVLTAVSLLTNTERVSAVLEMLKAMQPVEPLAEVKGGTGPVLYQLNYVPESGVKLYATPEQAK